MPMKTQVRKERNAGFDFLKYICAFLIICIHTDFFGKSAVLLIARAAVPVFFMITGYFFSTVVERGRQHQQISKILKITILANAVYLLWSLAISIGSVGETLRSWADISVWLKFLFLNLSPFRSHLWYLSAHLYVLIIACILEKAGIRHKIYVLIPILLALNLVLGNYSGLIFGTAIPLEYSRNFLLIGFPCFLLGDLLYQRRNSRHPKNGTLVIVLIGSLALSLAEVLLLTKLECYENQDFTLGNIFTAYAMFSLVGNNPTFFENSLCKKVAWMGTHLSLGIYIFNAIFRTVVEKIIEIVSGIVPLAETASHYTMPLMMLAIDSCIVYVWFWMRKKVTHRREK